MSHNIYLSIYLFIYLFIYFYFLEEGLLEEQEIQTIKSTIRVSLWRDETEQFERPALFSDIHQPGLSIFQATSIYLHWKSFQMICL